jgi:hypothetical protein
VFSEPSWGFIYNSVPFGMNFEQTLEFLYNAKLDEAGRNGIELAQSILDSRGGTQIVFPVIGSTMQGSGYFPQPIGKPNCNAGDTDCDKHGNGIGLAGLVGLENPIWGPAARCRGSRMRHIGEKRPYPHQDSRVLSGCRRPIRSVADAKKYNSGLRIRQPK